MDPPSSMKSDDILGAERFLDRIERLDLHYDEYTNEFIQPWANVEVSPTYTMMELRRLYVEYLYWLRWPGGPHDLGY